MNSKWHFIHSAQSSSDTKDLYTIQKYNGTAIFGIDEDGKRYDKFSVMFNSDYRSFMLVAENG